MLPRVADKLERYLDLLSFRQKLVASNLANIDTPGYKTRDISFAEELRTAETKAAPQVVQPELPAKNDGNNVSLDRETRLLAENGLRFQMAALLLKSEIRKVRSAIQEGRG